MPDRGASTVVVVVCGTCARCMYSTRVCVYIRITNGSDMDTYRGAVTQSKFLLVPDRTQYQPPNDVVVDVVAEHSLAPCAVVTSLTEVKTVAGTALRG